MPLFPIFLTLETPHAPAGTQTLYPGAQHAPTPHTCPSGHWLLLVHPHVSVLLRVWSPQKLVPSAVATQMQSSDVPQKKTPTPVQLEEPPQPDD
jgi:hypothetical protein